MSSHPFFPSRAVTNPIDLYGSLHVRHIPCRNSPNAVDKTRFTHRGELIRHRLALLALEGNQCLTRIEAPHVTRQWDDL